MQPTQQFTLFCLKKKTALPVRKPMVFPSKKTCITPGTDALLTHLHLTLHLETPAP
jgi:hypothetical protein